MEFFRNIFGYPLAEQIANLHGLFAFLCLIALGATFAVVVMIRKGYGQENMHRSLACLLGIQTALTGLLSTSGIVVYVAYRAAGGARDFLQKDPAIAWLHGIVFEYKEYLGAITPWLLIMVSFFLVLYLGKGLSKNKSALNFILAANTVSAFFLMLVAGLAVLVAKVAPIQKFDVGSDIFTRGGNLVLLAALVTAAILGGIFWALTRTRPGAGEDGKSNSSLAAMMYGSSVGLTLIWALNMAKEASPALKNSLAYINSVGPYSGVVFWSLVAIAVGTVLARVATMRAKKVSLTAAWVTLITCAVLQIAMFFPPFYKLFIS